MPTPVPSCYDLRERFPPRDYQKGRLVRLLYPGRHTPCQAQTAVLRVPISCYAKNTT
jgi:hypothetical protein